jgi:hypothetical protein
MLFNAKSQVHPISHCIVPLSHTLDRCSRLGQSVHLTPATILSYNSLRVREMKDLSFDKYYATYGVTSPLLCFLDIAITPVLDNTDLFLLFDAQELLLESQFVDCCSRLGQLVHLTPAAILSYNSLRVREMKDLSFDKYYATYGVTSPLLRFLDIAITPVSDNTDLFLFFDAQELILESQFVDCCSTAVELEGVCTNIDFFDFEVPTFAPSPFD